RLEPELGREAEPSLPPPHAARSRDLRDRPELAQLPRERKLVPGSAVNEGGVTARHPANEPVLRRLGAGTGDPLGQPADAALVEPTDRVAGGVAGPDHPDHRVVAPIESVGAPRLAAD